MKKLLFVLMFLCITTSLYAYGYEWSRDYYGHPTKQQNLWNDRDGDGVSNYWDVRDDDPYRW